MGITLRMLAAMLLPRALAALPLLMQRLPGRCLLCHAWPAPSLCDECLARFARPQPRCATCALPVPAGVERCGACLRAPPPLRRCIAAVDWAWPWTQCIGQMKFSSQPGLAAPLAAVLARAEGVAALLACADALLPMPASARRMAERGYNPALLLARQLAAHCPDAPPVQHRWLQHPRHTPPQHTLPRKKRLKNLHGALAVPLRHAADVQGKRLVLLDDVMTTGASLHEAAHTLLAAGASEVSAIVLARARAARK